MIIPLEPLSPNKVYFTMIQTLIPRPIAWTLSENSNGSFNLAPFSYFNAVCSDPPLLMISIAGKPDGQDKDTRVNIEERKDFVVHIAHREMASMVTQTSAMLPAGVSELEQAGLDTTEFEGSRLPRLSDCRVAYACTLHEIQEIGNAHQSLVLGRITHVYVDDNVIVFDDKERMQVMPESVDPIARLGGADYTTFGEKVTIPRPK